MKKSARALIGLVIIDALIVVGAEWDASAEAHAATADALTLWRFRLLSPGRFDLRFRGGPVLGRLLAALLRGFHVERTTMNSSFTIGR